MKPGRLQIRGLYSDLHADFAAKVERRSLLAASQLSEPSGQGLETVELAIRTTMTSCWSGSWDSARGHRGPMLRPRPSGRLHRLPGEYRHAQGGLAEVSSSGNFVVWDVDAVNVTAGMGREG